MAYTEKDIALMVKLRDGGAKWPEVLAKTGLNHVVAEREYMRHQFIKGGGKVVAATPENVVRLRGEGFSWGQITVRVGAKTEASVRTLYTAGSGELSQGIRNGHGGRFLGGDQELYQGTLQPTGTKITKEEGRRGARLAAFRQRLVNMELPELKQFAADNGVTVKKGQTKAQIAMAITKALNPATPAVKVEAAAS